jgi:hypothetical protein
VRPYIRNKLFFDANHAACKTIAFGDYGNRQQNEAAKKDILQNLSRLKKLAK